MQETGLILSPEDNIGGLNKERSAPGPNQVEIGTSLYAFSEEAQRYIFPIKLVDFNNLWLGLPPEQNQYPDYERKKSVLIVSDPHNNATAQFRLFKGLEVFFRDNPELVKRTVFLAEGYSAGQTVSVQSLLDIDPHPSDQLIRTVLESFLIPGYVAYEWKNQQGIPIVGAEDQPLHDLSVNYALESMENPEKILLSSQSREIDDMTKRLKPKFWHELQSAIINPLMKGKTIRLKDDGDISVTVSNELTWNVTFGGIQRFIVGARDHKMARTLIESSNKYENPMLFMGEGHLEDVNNSWSFGLIKLLIFKSGPNGPLGSEAWSLCREVEKKGVYSYLKDESIGFTFLDPEKLGDTLGDEITYKRLYQVQQRTGNYAEYINKFLPKIRSKKETTVRPSPEMAAEYVRSLKEEREDVLSSGVIYDRKQNETKTEAERPNWIKLDRDDVWNGVVKDSIWHQPPKYQGDDFEDVRNVNLGSNCPHIDDIVLNAETVTQHKSMDLTAKSYQDPKEMAYTVTKYIDNLDETTQGYWKWKEHSFQRGKDFNERYLELGIPLGKASQQQVDKLIELQEYAQTRDVTLVIVEVP